MNRFSSNRQWLALAAALFVVLVIVAAISVHGASNRGKTAGTTVSTLAGTAVVRLGSGTWMPIALPVTADHISSIDVAPSDPNTAYLCAKARAFQPSLGPVTLWQTQDMGAHWHQLALPSISGIYCEIAVAKYDPSRLVVAAQLPHTTQRACTDLQLAISSDGGATWQTRRFNAPTALLTQDAYCAVWPTAHHLYIEYSYSVAQGTNGAWQQVIRFVRSDDDGLTWQIADQELGTPSLFHAFALSDENSFVASIASEPYQPGKAPQLWATHDGGQHWARLGNSIGGTFVFAPPNTNAPSRQLPWYTLSGEQTNNVSVYQSFDSATWVRVPRLPFPGTTPDVTKALTVLPDGTIVVLGGDPNLLTTPTPIANPLLNANQDLWFWNPQRQQWGYLDAPIAVHHVGCGLCPASYITTAVGPDGRQPGIYLWIYDSEGQGEVLHRIFVADSIAA